MFDTNWNSKIYKKSRQINKYPFDWVVSSVNALFISKIKENRKLNAIELGSGTGNNLKFLKEFGFHKIIGIEGSKSANILAKKFLKNNKSYKLISADFINIPFKDNYFDLCLDRGSITHNDIKSIKQTLTEVKRVLKPGGYFLSSIFSKKHSEYLNSKNKSQTLKVFKDEMNVKSGIKASFFNFLELKRIYKDFEILEAIHEQKIDKINLNDNSAMWNIILRLK